MDILIVENDVIVTKMWSKKLSDSHEVRVAISVAEARTKIAEKMPDLVILDLRLNGPTNSGLNVYEFIRNELDEDTPIIFITGLAYSVDLFKKAQAFTESDSLAGVTTRMVEKPIRINDLSKMVNSLVAA
jgi:CheY-like chemotaxis protein